MQLLCNGVFLDLKKGTRFALKKVNPLFAFDKLTCERTTEFEIPDTAKNDRVFSLSKLPAFKGDAMRQRFAAELQDGTLVKRGFLYVSGYSRGAYKAVFVTGELVGLQAIRNAGKIAEIISPADTVVWSTDVYDIGANTPNLRNFELVTYKDALQSGWHRTQQVNPSYSLQYLLTLAMAALHKSVSIPASFPKARVIVGDIRGGEGNVTINNTIRDYSQPQTTMPTGAYNNTTFSSLSEFFEVNTARFASYREVGDDYKTYYYRMAQAKALTDMELTFPEDTPNSVFIVSFNIDGQTNYEFLGDYSFVKAGTQVITTGTPLAGRTISIQRGTCFVLLTPSDFVFEDMAGGGRREGWKITTFPSSRTFYVKTNVTNGSVVRLADNLPDFSVIELLQIVAALSGTVLNYTEADGITFDPVNTATWPIVDFTNELQGVDNLTRTFGDYAQRNVIEYKSDESVLQAERIREEYDIQNVNIQEEKVLQTIPFSEGGAIPFYGETEYVYIRNSGEGYKPADVLAVASSIPELIRSRPRKNTGIQTMCASSTTIRARIHVSVEEYDRVTSNTKILLRGTSYVWTESNWQDGTATFTLAKI